MKQHITTAQIVAFGLGAFTIYEKQSKGISPTKKGPGRRPASKALPHYKKVLEAFKAEQAAGINPETGRARGFHSRLFGHKVLLGKNWKANVRNGWLILRGERNFLIGKYHLSTLTV